MKRVFVLCLCFALFACAPVARREDVTSQTAAGPSEPVTAEASAAPEVERFPVTEAIVTLPQTVEPVNLEDHLLIYVSDGATYLYAYGESILLHQGGIYAHGPYNYLTEGTALTFIEPSDGTLRIIDLDDPHKTPVTVDPDAVNGVKRFATSQGDNDFLFLKDEDGEIDGEPLETLYLYKNGEAKRIEESVGRVDQFSLSLDGNSFIFYMDEPLGDFLVVDGGEPIGIKDYIEDVSEDFQTVLAGEGKALKLYRKDTEPMTLSDDYEAYGYSIERDGTVCWSEHDHTLWQFDGIKKVKLLENVEGAHIIKSDMYAFFRDGSLYVQFGDDAPLLVCAQEPGQRVFLSYILDDGGRIVYGTKTDFREDADSFMHETTYVVTVDRSGVSEPTLISDDNYRVVPFRDDFIVVKTEDAITCNLYFKGKLVGVVDELWNNFHGSGEGENEQLYFHSEGRFCRFDGEKVTVIFDSIPETTFLRFRMLEDGTFLYWDGDGVYYYDGAVFHRILEGVENYLFAPFLRDALGERLIHD